MERFVADERTGLKYELVGDDYLIAGDDEPETPSPWITPLQTMWVMKGPGLTIYQKRLQRSMGKPRKPSCTMRCIDTQMFFFHGFYNHSLELRRISFVWYSFWHNKTPHLLDSISYLSNKWGAVQRSGRGFISKGSFGYRRVTPSCSFSAASTLAVTASQSASLRVWSSARSSSEKARLFLPGSTPMPR